MKKREDMVYCDTKGCSTAQIDCAICCNCSSRFCTICWRRFGIMNEDDRFLCQICMKKGKFKTRKQASNQEEFVNVSNNQPQDHNYTTFK